jgi:hypothetical protein
MSERALQGVIRAIPASDGAGVKLMRSLGQASMARLDPFLMLDCFSSEEASDYIAGFPPHPHRGFETVTYMLDGHMRHEDHLGNVGELRSGGAQWMTAGRGIIHSEMPQQESGRMRGFQLWINLPAKEKMKPASYQDIQAERIPLVALPGGGSVKVVAGSVAVEGREVSGPIAGITTQPLFLDVSLPEGGLFRQALPAGHNGFLYPYEGRVAVGEASVGLHQAGILTMGDQVTLRAEGGPAKFLLLAAQPLNEPIVQYGPFVMNSREEIEQAIHDYQTGKLVEG